MEEKRKVTVEKTAGIVGFISITIAISAIIFTTFKVRISAGEDIIKNRKTIIKIEELVKSEILTL